VKKLTQMKVALVYDRVNKFGGAERLLLALHRVFPKAPLYTLVYDPPKAGWAKVFKVIPTFLNFLAPLRSRHELLAPIAPLAFETLNLDKFDLVISITSSDAKAVITKPRTTHVCYCLTPTRYFWSGKQEYFSDMKMKLLPNVIKKYLRSVDLLTSSRPDAYIAISSEVKSRISDYYHRDSTVVRPPIEDKFFTKQVVIPSDRDFYLVVSRLVPYKRVDLVIEAFNKLKSRLVIIGSGSEMARLKNIAGSNITFLGQVSDETLLDHYRRAKAVIFPQEEDFGLVPLEAQASGTPVIAYGKGGAKETIIPGKTGLFFQEQTEESLASCLEKFEKVKWNYQDCVKQASKFSFTRFKNEFLATLTTIQMSSDHLQ